MSKWTNTRKIMQDLSVAQGRIVPASLEATFGDNGPPASGVTEETEEEYYKDWTGDGDFAAGPDISLIQEMLSMVKDYAISSDEDSDKFVVISKLSATSPEFVPKAKRMELKPKESPCKQSQATPSKKKHVRNVALTSLLNNIENQIEPVIDVQKENVIELNFKKSPVFGYHMFKRKQIEKTKKPVSEPLTNNIHQPSYVPSALAKDYYEKYLENSKKKVIQEDIWTRLEKELKTIDERKRQEALVSTSPSSSSHASCDDDTPPGSPPDDCASALDKVCLPQQRHLLKAGLDCAVCEVFKKNVYDIKETL